MTTGATLAVACRYSFAGLRSGPKLFWLPPARACLLQDAWKDCVAGKEFDGLLTQILKPCVASKKLETLVKYGMLCYVCCVAPAFVHETDVLV